MSEQGLRIGIDLGGTNIKAGLVRNRQQIIAAASRKTQVSRPWTEVVRDMGECALELLEREGLSPHDCLSVGVGSPGTTDAARGVVLYSNNFGWENIPLMEELRRYLPLPMAISNDANCAALGETVAGAAKDCKNVILLTLGTGVGGGVILNGSIFEGGHAGGAELGHTTLIAGGELCTCGRRGCLEAYASATALIRQARAAMAQNSQSLLGELCEGDPQKMNGRIPFEAARAGDAAALAVVRQYTAYLGDGIVNMVNIFRPEKVLLSGGVCNEGAYLTDPLEDWLRQHAFGGDKAFVPPVARATLGNDAGIIGAASLPDA